MWSTLRSGCSKLGVVLILLIATFVAAGAQAQDAAHRVNLAAGLPYWTSLPPEGTYPDSGRELTDGVKGPANFGHPAWQGHLRNEFRVVTLDLGAVKPVHKVTIGFLYDPGAGIGLPGEVRLYTSVDGRNWAGPKTVTQAMLGTPAGAARRQAEFTDVGLARYIRLIFTVSVWAFIDEVEVWGEDREVSVQSPTDLLDLSDPFLGFDTAAMGPAFSLHVAPNKNADAYLPAGSEAAGGARHIVLIYTHERWTVNDALPYVA